MNPFLISSLSFLLLFAAAGRSGAQQVAEPSSPSTHELVQDCLRQLWSLPVFWDQRAIAPIDPSVCEAKPQEIEQSLKAQHFLALHTSNAVLLVQENSFDKSSGPFQYLWKTPVIDIRVVPRVTSDSRPPTQDELHEIVGAILKQSHLVPLTCPFKSNGQFGRLAFSVAIEIHKMRPGLPQESVIAVLADSDPDQKTVLGAGRIVFGILENHHFEFRWESPLLEASMFQSGFVDLLRDGNLQIVLTSNIGMGNHTAFYAFDLNGRELSRQPNNCEAFSDLAKHAASACPILTETSVQIEDTAAGPKELLATDEAGKKVRYHFVGTRYEESPSSRSLRPPSIPRATALNKQGMELMQQGEYQSALAKFEEAAQLNPSDPLFANNAGFAYYKLGKVEESLYWLKKAVQMDPTRAVAYLNLGDAFAKLQRNTEAREAYQKYLDLAPSSKAAPEVRKRLDALPSSP